MSGGNEFGFSDDSFHGLPGFNRACDREPLYNIVCLQVVLAALLRCVTRWNIPGGVGIWFDEYLNCEVSHGWRN